MEIVHHAVAGGGVGQPQRTHHREGLAAAVADHADPFHPQQQGPAVFGMVESLLDADQVAAEKGGAHLAAPTPRQLGPQHVQENPAHRFEELQQHVAGEAVAHHHVEFSGEHVPALAVAGEHQALFRRQQGVGLQGEIVALAFLLTDVQQADARSPHLQDVPAVDAAHQGELMEPGRFAVAVGAHVEHEDLLVGILGGKEGADGGPIDAGEPTGQVLVVPTGPADQQQRLTMMICEMAALAKERLWISTPYFVPDEAVAVALETAVARGVDVRVLVPIRPDHVLVFLAGYYYEARLLKAGGKVYRYEHGFMHQKAALVDDSIAMIGTANLDNRSLHLNFELSVLSPDRRFVADVEKMLANDFDRSKQSEVGGLSKKPFLFQILVGAARLFSPVL